MFLRKERKGFKLLFSVWKIVKRVISREKINFAILDAIFLAIKWNEAKIRVFRLTKFFRQLNILTFLIF